MKEKHKLLEIIKLTERVNHSFGQLGYFLGQRNIIASQMFNESWLNHKNPEEYKQLLVDSFNHIEDNIKQLLIID